MTTPTADRLNPAHLPAAALFGLGEGIGWRLSPTPISITEAQLADLRQLGPRLWAWVQACDLLYRESVAGRAPAWVADWLDQGKPPALVADARMKRLKSHLPRVLRPDLLMTDTGWAMTELDSVPGGLGFTAALNAAYRQSGVDVIEGPLPDAFARLLRSLTPAVADPVWVILVSDEAGDYRPELTWLVQAVRDAVPGFRLLLRHPKDVDLIRDRLVVNDDAGAPVAIDGIYRFFELFDLPNIPKMPLIQYAVRKGWVACTPPFKPALEEKLWLALLHHPALAGFWRAQLGQTDYEALQAIVPPSWVLDPAPMPPQGVIQGLTVDGTPLQSFEALAGLSQRQRQLVIKPSGFSPLAWGSRGVRIGHDLAGDAWAAGVHDALAAFGQTPHVLQAFWSPAVLPLSVMELPSGAVNPFPARVRLCPYYFVQGETPELVGILATACPANKKIIHGMTDAVMAPVALAPRQG